MGDESVWKEDEDEDGEAPDEEKDEEAPGWSRCRLALSYVLQNPFFDWAITVAILINLLLIIVETDHRAKGKGDSLPEWVNVSNSTLLGIYTIELFMRLYVHRWRFFRRRVAAENALDTAIVTAGWACEVLGSVSFLNILRLLRVIRMAKPLRFLSGFHELHFIVYGMGAAMRAIFWSTILTFIIISLWSLLAVEFIQSINATLTHPDDCLRCTIAFASVMESNLTFFLLIIAGDGWENHVVPLVLKEPLTMILFVGMYATVVLGFMNLILGVIVEQATKAHEDDAKHKLKQKHQATVKGKQVLMDVCAELDLDGSGHLTLSEMIDGFHNSAAFNEAMHLLDVGETDLMDLFKIMDEDHSGQVSYHEFTEELHKLHANDVHTILFFLKHHVSDIRDVALRDMHALQNEIHSATTNQQRLLSRHSAILSSLHRTSCPEVPMPEEGVEILGTLQSEGSEGVIEPPADSTIVPLDAVGGEVPGGEQRYPGGALLPLRTVASAARAAGGGPEPGESWDSATTSGPVAVLGAGLGRALQAQLGELQQELDGRLARLTRDIAAWAARGEAPEAAGGIDHIVRVLAEPTDPERCPPGPAHGPSGGSHMHMHMQMHVHMQSAYDGPSDDRCESRGAAYQEAEAGSGETKHTAPVNAQVKLDGLRGLRL